MPRPLVVFAILVIAFRAQSLYAQASSSATSTPVATQPDSTERFERPYFVTYDHSLEEPRDLDIEVLDTTGVPQSDRPVYFAPWLEIEYGVTTWWTTELYLEGVAARDGSGRTGWRLEQRFRPWQEDRPVNLVLYLEYEQITEASRIQTEVLGSGPLPDDPIRELRHDSAHEVESRLILSGDTHRWNIAGNIIFEKNLSEQEGVEFGYSAGVYHLFGPQGSARCQMCGGTFGYGIETYGALGSTIERGLHDTQHFIAPAVAWRAGSHVTIKTSAGFGLTSASERALLRVGVVLEP